MGEIDDNNYCTLTQKVLFFREKKITTMNYKKEEKEKKVEVSSKNCMMS